MKISIFKSILVLCIVTTSVISCSDNVDAASPPPPPALPEFLYAEGGATSMSTVTTPYANASSKSIFAVNGGSTVMEIRLSSLAVATYTINATNMFTYFKPGTAITWTGFTGTVTVTGNLDNRLTGSFNINSGNGSPMINEVNGTFSNIIINP